MAESMQAKRDIALTDPAEKRLDEMDRLGDMTHFPAVVNAGATVNVLLTIALTWWLAVRFPSPAMPLGWILLVLALNLAPVLMLRLATSSADPMPTLRSMDFVRDQHKFSDWVYLAASANMAFWILLAWTGSRLQHTGSILATLMVVAALTTFSPVLLRRRQ